MTSTSRSAYSIDWKAIAAGLDERGYAVVGPILTPEQCAKLINLYDDKNVFRSRVVMQRHNFGRGEYQYFGDPLPEVVQGLRESLYPPLAQIANHWAQRLGQSDRFPLNFAEFLNICRERNQTLPTPLMLRYQTDDYNCMHQDLYGEIAFPLQAACVLSQRERDYTGGEFLLTEQRPRMQTRAEAVSIERGHLIVFPNRWRPVAGKRGEYRVNVRHGVSRLRSGERFCLGLIFHNAK